MGSTWVGGGGCGEGGGGLLCTGQQAVITFEEGSERGGGRRFVLDKQAMFAYLPSAFSPPSISILNVSFAYYWLAVRLSLDKKLDR
jgi:hypothetical protein